MDNLEDEATPEEQQAALIQALKLRMGGAQAQPQAADFYRGWGNMAQQSGDRVLGAFGQSQVSQAQQMDRGDGALLLKAMSGRRGPMAKTPEELDNLAASAELKRWKTHQPPKDKSFSETTGLRKELSSLPETKAMAEAESSYSQITTAANNATGDVARIYALAKTFDPGGRVTDSDYSAAKQGQGPMARFQGLINEVEAQGFLSDQTRKNMEATARGLIEKRRKDYAVTIQRFDEIAKGRGLNPKHVIVRPSGSLDIDLDAPAADWSDEDEKKFQAADAKSKAKKAGK